MFTDPRHYREIFMVTHETKRFNGDSSTRDMMVKRISFLLSFFFFNTEDIFSNSVYHQRFKSIDWTDHN